MSRYLVVTLRCLLVLMAIGVATGLVVAPLLAVQTGELYAEVDPLVVPYAAVAIVALLVVGVALLAIWRLLTLAARERVFDPIAFRSVDVVIACAVVVTVSAAALFAHLTFVAQIGGPLVLLGLIGSLVGGSTVTLLLVVMRELLRSAVADRQELAEVI